MMSVTTAPQAYQAVSFDLAPTEDRQSVELHIVTTSGKELNFVCYKDSLISMKHRIKEAVSETGSFATRDACDDYMDNAAGS